MIRNIFNWVGGGFFRTIGRFVAFIVLGAVAYILIGKSNIKITDLLGIETVKADTYQNAYYFNYYKDANLTQQYTSLSGGIASYDTLNKTPNANVSFTDRNWYTSAQPDIRQYAGGRISFPFELLYSDNVEISPDNTNQYYCSTWVQTSSGIYQCSTVGSQQAVSDYDIVIQRPKIIVQAILYYTNATTGNQSWRTCILNDNNHAIDCPVTNEMQGVLRLRTSTYVQGDSTTTYQVVIGKMVNVFADGTAQAIQDQTQQQQQQHNETMSYITDTNMTETNTTATSFFDNFSDTDHGGLSSIITAPLSTINNMLSNTCVAPSATWKGATITLPCGDLLWSREGADGLRNLLNVFYGGFICYYSIRRLFFLIENLKDPTKDNLEVTDL